MKDNGMKDNAIKDNGVKDIGERIDVNQWVNNSFLCSCGKEHSVGIEEICLEEDVIDALLKKLKDFRKKKIFVFSDKNTYAVSGDKIIKELINNGYHISHYTFQPEHDLIPNELAIGRAIVELPFDSDLIITIGSGTLNDLARIISYKLKIPYMIIGTAPSMDGYASTVSPLIIDGFKVTYEACYPKAIFGDLQAMEKAPNEMIYAGFGDIIGKFTALSDWKLSKIINGEYYCDHVANLMNEAIKQCVDYKESIKLKQKEGLRYLTEALILSGIAMGLIGNSRPASGSEHHLSHYWEMDALKRKVHHPLHGNMVGVGTVVITTIYEKLQEYLPEEIKVVKPSYVQSLLNSVGAIDNPKDLGISKELFRDSILNAKEVRPRYTIFHFAESMGILEKLADELVEIFY